MAAGLILTHNGRNLLAKALAGKNLAFTRAWVGTGTLGSRDPYSLSDLVSRKLELPITAIRTSSTGTAEITVEITNSKLTAGFFMREYGLFAKDPDSQSELLYAYCNKADEAGYLEGFDGTNPIHFTLSFITVIDTAQNVTAVISAGSSYVTQTMLDARVLDLFANPTQAEGFFSYAANDERRLRPMKTADARKALIGTADINSLIDRVRGLEDAVNQITLSLNVQEIYPAAERFIAEDFLEPDTVDLYSAQVTSIVAGDDSLDCDPVEGLLPGSWYTISDGVNSEMGQCESISLENGIMRVILTAPVKNTYSLATCRIMRTTADVKPGNAYGASSSFLVSWMPGVTWQGRSQGSSFTAMLDTSISAHNRFTFTGNAVLDADGYLTMEE